MDAVNELDPEGIVVRALALELKTSEDRIRSARSLKDDLKMDSIAAANVAFMIEEECGVEVEFDEADSFDTLEAIVAIVGRAFSAMRE